MVSCIIYPRRVSRGGSGESLPRCFRRRPAPGTRCAPRSCGLTGLAVDTSPVAFSTRRHSTVRPGARFEARFSRSLKYLSPTRRAALRSPVLIVGVGVVLRGEICV